MAAWAKRHTTEFYRLYARLIPTEAHIDYTHQRDVRELSTEELMEIAARGRQAQEDQSQGNAEQSDHRAGPHLAGVDVNWKLAMVSDGSRESP